MFRQHFHYGHSDAAISLIAMYGGNIKISSSLEFETLNKPFWEDSNICKCQWRKNEIERGRKGKIEIHWIKKEESESDRMKNNGMGNTKKVSVCV